MIFFNLPLDKSHFITEEKEYDEKQHDEKQGNTGGIYDRRGDGEENGRYGADAAIL